MKQFCGVTAECTDGAPAMARTVCPNSWEELAMRVVSSIALKNDECKHLYAVQRSRGSFTSSFVISRNTFESSEAIFLNSSSTGCKASTRNTRVVDGCASLQILIADHRTLPIKLSASGTFIGTLSPGVQPVSWQVWWGSTYKIMYLTLNSVWRIISK